MTDPAALPVREVQDARREQRLALGRRQILDVAEEMFGDRGYYRTSLKAVAERCEMAVGSLYKFFEGKDALYQAVLRRRGIEQHDLMREAARADRSGLDLLVDLARVQVEFFRSHPAYGKLATVSIAPGARNDGLDVESFMQGYQEALDIVRGAIVRGQQDGTIRPGNPAALARVFAATVGSFHLMDPSTSRFPEDFEIDEMLALIRAAFAA